MALAATLRRGLRRLLERKGYWVRHCSVLPFGIEYQRDIERIAQKFAIPIRVFVDIGANVGQSSEAALRQFPEAAVFAFEPDESTFAELTTRVRDPRFHAINMAMSNVTGDASFFDYGALATSNGLVENSQFSVRSPSPVKVRIVACETIDEFCVRLRVDRIDVLKIDTEGHDLAVLEGASRMLSERRIRFVYVEFNTLLPKSGTIGGALLPIGELLESAGFKFVASYPEYMITTAEFFVASNALFVYQ